MLLEDPREVVWDLVYVQSCTKSSWTESVLNYLCGWMQLSNEHIIDCGYLRKTEGSICLQDLLASKVSDIKISCFLYMQYLMFPGIRCYTGLVHFSEYLFNSYDNLKRDKSQNLRHLCISPKKFGFFASWWVIGKIKNYSVIEVVGTS